MADDGATPSSSSKSHFICDVFLSFRGDTRHGFTDHLFKTLVNRGIKAFRDDPGLRFGDEIGPALLDAIDRSRMSIVVFSQGYASSSWCLDELVKIVERKEKGRRVFPIFYHVEPSDVRYQKNQYEKDMVKHENGRNSHKVQAWRAALSKAGNLRGRHYKGGRDSIYETDFIDKICEEISEELLHIKHPRELPREFEGMEAPKSNNKKEEEDIVGFEDSLSTVITQLRANEKLFPAISRLELGKTSLARMLCNISPLWFPNCARSCVSEDFNEFDGMEAPKSNNKREEGDTVGFEDILSAVITQLKEENPSRNVVSITGMGGSGKTTLAQMVYNNNEVKELFSYRAWSCVSEDFNKKKVLLELLKCLYKQSTSEYEKSSAKDLKKLSAEDLEEKVTDFLNGKKYLVVLDDIWETRVWNEVKCVFPNCNNGSMILITSRDDQVANHARSRTPHQQPPPLNALGWELFCKKVFGKEECPHDLVDVGKSIVKKCGGLPLAIVAMAGVIAMKDRLQLEWSQIEGSVAWDLAQDSTKVIDALKTSYAHLPKMLKPCFLHFGVYPGGYKINAKELIQLWIAGGFIKPENTLTSEMPEPEVLGDRYLKELVYRNLIQVEERRSDGGVKICRIHDLFRELCIIESKTDNFLQVCTKSTKNSLSNSFISSLLCIGEYCKSLIKCGQSSTCSLFLFGGKEYHDYIMLHVARGLIRITDEVPYDLTKKIMHLKYLKVEISYSGGTGTLDWISSLRNLEMVDIKFCCIVDKTGGTVSIWKLERLRHLKINPSVKLGEDKEGAINNKRMWNLQTLSMVKLEPETRLPLSNGCFPILTKLGLAFCPSMARLLHKQSLNLRPLSNLRKLKLMFLRISLDQIIFPSNISKITLREFDVLDSGYLSALGRIINLRILKLVNGKAEPELETLNCGAARGDFPWLQVFHIEFLYNVKRLTLENGAMPRLHRMVIRPCYKLKEVPERLLSLCDSW